MQDECELRLDIPLPNGGTARQFERGWRDVLSAQGLTVLAVPPAQALSVRFRVCNLPGDDLLHYLPRRLHALPGSPRVLADANSAPTEWCGVRVWLSFRAQDLPDLLQRPKRKHAQPRSRARGRRP